MKKLSLSLLAAGLLAGAGLAQADTLVLTGHNVVTTAAANGQKTFWIDTPVIVGPHVPGAMPVVSIDSTPVAVIDSSSVLAAAPVLDTTVLGAGPVMADPEPMMVPPGLIWHRY